MNPVPLYIMLSVKRTAVCVACEPSQVELRLEDIQTIVMTLVYDGRVDEVEPDDEADDQDHYRWASGEECA